MAKLDTTEGAGERGLPVLNLVEGRRAVETAPKFVLPVAGATPALFLHN